eukprot:Opistho-2@71350
MSSFRVAVAISAVVVALAASAASRAVGSDPTQITSLPGLSTPLSFSQYSGYITVDESHARQLYYFFAESQNSPAKDPLVLWFNGGPGCSSMGGLAGEHGPFYPNTDGRTLRVNPYSWNRVANMLYVDSPSGVGFSFSGNSSDYTTGDAQTAADAVNFLVGFLARYPDFASNPVYISGESYAGHYVPNLVKAIILSNDAGVNPHINLAGFLVGNPWTDASLDNYGTALSWVARSLNSQPTFDAIAAKCDFSQIGPLKKAAAWRRSVPADECSTAVDTSSKEMGSIDIYDIYTDVCLSQSPKAHMTALLNAIGAEGYEDDAATFARMLASKINGKQQQARRSTENPPEDDACIDNHVQQYFNLPEVKAAIHASSSISWSDCNGVVNYSREDLLTSMLPVYQYLVARSKGTESSPALNLRMLVFSGDVDGIVATTGTRLWIDKLALPVTEAWRPWTASDKQVGGYVTKYDGLTFATVRNAGHMVPWTQPVRALDLFSRFLNNEAI